VTYDKVCTTAIPHQPLTCYSAVEDGLKALPVAHTQCAQAGQQRGMEAHSVCACWARNTPQTTMSAHPTKHCRTWLPCVSLQASSGLIQAGHLQAMWSEPAARALI